ncbi:MAG: PQQ-dependent sugar dehydrogenase [Chloroflexi bacterium]|jgi:glucose/arabinose dehydrogenase|nr:PQQ-dependent sugar dehydrogenase [Chloroflexota bacterium]
MQVKTRIGLTAVLVVSLISGFSMLLAQAALPTSDAAAQARLAFSPALEKVGEGFTLPLFLTHANDGSGRIFVVEKGGTIALLENGKRGTVFLDIRDRVRASGYEQGLLGLAFHPDYARNGYFYVNYTNRQGHTVIERYSVLQSDPNRADPNSAKRIMLIKQPYANHNGGMIAFGPDGLLYIGMGDGGGANDPLGAGQNKRTLLGKILRIDVDNGDPYAIPADNPYADGREGLPEIWSIGWRNPWRFSFDRLTGDMYIADVGQNRYEEVHIERRGAKGGLNYGWNIMEGAHCFQPRTGCNRDGLQMPIAEYDHSQGISITGGYVYRGSAFPRMQGYYFFADFGSTKVWALRETSADTWEMTEVMSAHFPVSSFGEDEAGELYLVDFSGGTIHRLMDRE